MAREAMQLIRNAESDLLFYHSTRVYCWGAAEDPRKGRSFDPELLYIGAMFHDIGLTQSYRCSQLRFEVNGANAVRTAICAIKHMLVFMARARLSDDTLLGVAPTEQGLKSQSVLRGQHGLWDSRPLQA